MQGTIDLAGYSHQQGPRDRTSSIPLAEFDVADPEFIVGRVSPIDRRQGDKRL